MLRRNLIHAFKNPALLIPSIVFPLLFLVAFAGGLSNVANVPGFDFPSGYTAFQFVFVFLQAAAFGGVFTGFSAAADFESGFGRRLLLGAPRREGIIAGYALAAIGALPAHRDRGHRGRAALRDAGRRQPGAARRAPVARAAGQPRRRRCGAPGMALRFQTLQAGPAMQIPVFLILFMAPVYVPLHLIKGWVNHAASYNPLTAIIEAGRGFLSGQPETVGLAYLAGVGLVALGLVWAVTGLRRAERGV